MHLSLKRNGTRASVINHAQLVIFWCFLLLLLYKKKKLLGNQEERWYLSKRIGLLAPVSYSITSSKLVERYGPLKLQTGDDDHTLSF